jgi:hypothetical protein
MNDVMYAIWWISRNEWVDENGKVKLFETQSAAQEYATQVFAFDTWSNLEKNGKIAEVRVFSELIESKPTGVTKCLSIVLLSPSSGVTCKSALSQHQSIPSVGTTSVRTPT